MLRNPSLFSVIPLARLGGEALAFGTVTPPSPLVGLLLSDPPPQEFAAAVARHPGCANGIIDLTGNFDACITLLQLAVACKRPELAEVLLRHGADPNSTALAAGVPAAWGWVTETPLVLARMTGCLRSVELLRRWGARPDSCGETTGRSDIKEEAASVWHRVFSMEAGTCRFELASQALKDGADVNATDARAGGHTPLTTALTQGDTQLAALLLQSGADASACTTDGMCAWQHWLKAGAPGYMDATDTAALMKGAGESRPLMDVALSLPKPARHRLAHLALEQGHNANEVDEATGETLVYKALRDADMALLGMALDHGADPMLRTTGPYELLPVTALQRWLANGAPGMVRCKNNAAPLSKLIRGEDQNVARSARAWARDAGVWV